MIERLPGRPKMHPARKRSKQLIVLVSEIEMQHIDHLRKQRSRSAWGHAIILAHLKEVAGARKQTN